MPIHNQEDAVEVEGRIKDIFAASPEQRAAAIRRLFVEVLDFTTASGSVSLNGAPATVTLPGSAERVATLDGVHVLYIALQPSNTDRVRKVEVDAAAKLIASQLGDDLLLVFTNPSASQLHLILPSFAGALPTLRRMVVERYLPRRTAVQQVSNIYWNNRANSSIRVALEQAFDVEPVTKQFFTEYKRVFEAVEKSVTGSAVEEREDRRFFVQTLFNRLMFIYFLQRKGWLTFKNDKDYLNAFWNAYKADSSQGDFYTTRLRTLFFSGLNNPGSRDVTEGLATLIGDVPFLNGGLFEETKLDSRDGVNVPDSAIELVLRDLFDKFNFTVMESTPFDIEVAVDPEMLGKVFEELVTGRHDSGSYYTPRPVVSFMCREALKGYLESQGTGMSTEDIALFVDHRDPSALSLAAARQVSDALDEVKVVDPACGSGAYLLGMMQELVELQTVLYSEKLQATSRDLYDLKLHIIQNNLYGVDIDEFAVNIAMLRMWLSLAIDYEGDVPPPLPNLDFKVLCGDSLLGPDPSAGVVVQGTLGQAADQTRRLGELKAKYMRASIGSDKGRLRSEIRELEERIRDGLGALGDAAIPNNVVDWRVVFAEVFADRRGFDVAIANPPYLQLQSNGGRLANLYKDAGYRTFARTGDIYQLFYERGCQLLRPSRGLLAYITSNSWMKAEYGKATRRYFSEGHTPLRLLELGKDVFESAIVDSAVLVLRTGGTGMVFPGVDMDRLSVKEIPPQESLWGRVRPDGDAPWSVLSPLEQSVMDKMQAKGTLLREWDVKINRGILTGYNEAFIINGATRQALVEQDSNSAEIIKPVLRGRDIQRYKAEWADLWLIDTHNGYRDVPGVDVNGYPAVKVHLDHFYSHLEKRQDKGGTPYNLRSCAYYDEFGKEKLFWMDMSPRGRFAYSDTEVYCNDKGFIMTGLSLKYLCAVLNSAIATWFIKNNALTTGLGLTQWKKFVVERLPIPKIADAQQRPFIHLVNRILAAKDADLSADTSAEEAEIDRLVYELYGLTEEEEAVVEGGEGVGGELQATGAEHSKSGDRGSV